MLPATCACTADARHRLATRDSLRFIDSPPERLRQIYNSREHCATRIAPPEMRLQPGSTLACDLWNQFSVHIREAHVASVEEIGQALVVDAQQVEDGGVEIE